MQSGPDEATDLYRFHRILAPIPSSETSAGRAFSVKTCIHSTTRNGPSDGGESIDPSEHPHSSNGCPASFLFPMLSPRKKYACLLLVGGGWLGISCCIMPTMQQNPRHSLPYGQDMGASCATLPIEGEWNFVWSLVGAKDRTNPTLPTCRHMNKSISM